MSRCSFASPSLTTSTSRSRASRSTAATGQPSGGTAVSIASLQGREGPDRAASGGVDVTPHDETIETELLHFLGLPFDLDGFYAWAEGDEILGLSRRPGSRASARRCRSTRSRHLVTSITAQQVSLQSAAAIRSRSIERFGVAGVHAHAFPERERVARATEDELIGVGFSTREGGVRHRPRPQRPRPGRLASLPDEEVTARLVALRGLGEWTAAVPRPPPREGARVAGRRSGTAQGGHRVLW